MALSKIDLANQVENDLPQANIANNINFRNIIINGDMSIAQRSTSESSYTSDAYSTVDRMKTRVGSLGTWTISQDTDVPTGQGFAKSLKWDCTIADASPSASDYLFLEHKIEGQNLQYLKYGTSSAQSTTLSFWVKSNKTGTGQVNLRDYDNDKLLGGTYTILSANTWEKKTITYIGNTSDTLDNDNAVSLALEFWLDSGSTYTGGTAPTAWEARDQSDRNASGTLSLGDSADNEFYITGVQLEAGTSASDFEFLPQDVNLQRCQRYYEVIAKGTSTTVIANASVYDGSYAYGVINYSTKRTAPSLDQVTGSNFYRLLNDFTPDTFDSFNLNNNNTTRGRMSNADTVSATRGDSGWFETGNASAYIAMDAEL